MAALKKSADASQTCAPENFIFHREWPKTDGAKPMGRGGWWTAWRNHREDTTNGDKEKGKPETTRLAGVQFFDLLHQSVTELCEAGMPESVIRELAGQVDLQMMRIYSQPRLAAKRVAGKAPGAVNVGPREGDCVTNHVTKALPPVSREMEFIEKNGRGERI